VARSKRARRFSGWRRQRVVSACILLAITLWTLSSIGESNKNAPGKEKDSGQTVDSGTFGVFMNGRRMGTESFSIAQNSNGSVITSDFKSEGSSDQAAQSAELRLEPNGNIRAYEWRELSPGRAHAEVVPNDNFLVERATSNPEQKPFEQPFLLPSSTNILDDYFFIDREVLAWKYLAIACHQEKGQLNCPVNQPTQFGALDPHSRSSMQISMQFSKREMVPVHGAPRDLLRFDLNVEGDDWALWLDDSLKLVRIVNASQNTEVVRD